MTHVLPSAVEIAETDRVKARQVATAVRVIGGTSEWLDGTALASECRSAVVAHPSVRRARLSDDETDALTQAVVTSVLVSHRPAEHGSPRAVLAYIERCERFPTLMAQRETGIARGAVGRRYLLARVSRILAGNADWQDTASQYRTRTQSQRGDTSMVAPTSHVRAPGEDAPTDSYALALERASALAGSSAGAFTVEPRDVRDLARATADLLTDGMSERIARQVTARLVQAATIAAGGDVVAAMRDLAAETGSSLKTLQNEASRGAKALAEVAPAEVAAAVRQASRETPGMARAATHDRISWAHLPRAAHGAAEAVAHITRSMGAWDPASIHTGRSLPAWPDTSRKPDAAPFPSLHRAPPQAPSAPRVTREPHRANERTNHTLRPLNGQPTTGSHGEAAWA